jgi:hypothetical protein
MSKLWLVVLILIAGVLSILAVTINGKSDISSSDHRDLPVNINTSTSSKVDLPNSPKANPASDAPLNSGSGHAQAAIKVPNDTNVQSKETVPQPTEQQLKDQALLEQRVNGQIYTEGPLIPAILKSPEFINLTKNQRDIIIDQITTRLNSGELKPEDAFPRPK